MHWRMTIGLLMCVSLVSTAVGAEYAGYYTSGGHTAWRFKENELGVYDVYLPITHPGQWPVVCFMHGAGGEFPDKDQPNTAQIDTLAPLLGKWAAKNGFALIVPRYQADEFRDYDEYRPPNQLLRMDDWQFRATSRLNLALEWLLPTGRLDLNRFALVGHSLGTMISLKLADGPPWYMNIPTPQVLVLLDPAGYEFGPLLASDTEWELNRNNPQYNTTDYDQFPNIPDTTHLVCLIAEDTWHYSFNYSAPGISFGNGNAGGVVSHAYWNTNCQRKDFMIVLGDPANNRPSEHGSAVDAASPHAEFYWRHVADACRDAFGGPTCTPYSYVGEFYTLPSHLGGHPYMPKMVVLPGVPLDEPYEWNTNMVLPGVVEQMLPEIEYQAVVYTIFNYGFEIAAAIARQPDETYVEWFVRVYPFVSGGEFIDPAVYAEGTGDGERFLMILIELIVEPVATIGFDPPVDRSGRDS